jgi:hypothetical protein
MRARPFRCLIGWHAWQMVAVDNLTQRVTLNAVDAEQIVNARQATRTEAAPAVTTRSSTRPDRDRDACRTRGASWL